MTFGWKALDDDPARAIDLAEVTGQSTWTTAEVEDYLMKCMARSVLTQAIALGKRGIVAADKYGGKMSWLWKEITAVSRGRVPIRHPAKYSVINDVTEPASPNAPMDRRVGAETRYITYICARMVEEVEVTVHAHDAVEWLNVNSGNTVSWLTLSIECAWDEDRDVEYDEYDDGDDGSVRTTRVDVPPGVYNLYSYRNFVRQVPRHFWRNG